LRERPFLSNNRAPISRGVAADKTMNRIETAIPGVYEFRPTVFEDARGFFMETYHAEKFRALGVADAFVQDNHSRSAKGTLRGLHYQLSRPQAKLCRLVEGEALDVAVDIRFGSPTFGRLASVKLSAAAHNLIYVPAGFAHGFLALTDSVQFLYKCSDFYFREDEHGVLWSDPDIGISWGISSPIVSEKDLKFSKLSDISRELLPRYSPK
jgi:dTDP-4-dehydrorhamnose 3,5-epimerase